MSAYNCNRATIVAVAIEAARPHDSGSILEGKATEIAKQLAAENARSVAYRYDEEPEPCEIGRVTGADIMRQSALSAIQIIKATNCLKYQSCETPDFECTAAFQRIELAREIAIRRLPGYSEADWGINEDWPLDERSAVERAEAGEAVSLMELVRS